ncbi:MAG: ChaN family lipoprotein [Alphaproteobacteria bacterium]
MPVFSQSRSFRVVGAVSGLCLGLVLMAACAPVIEVDPVPVPPWETSVLSDHPLTGRLFAPRSGDFLTPAQGLELAAAADFVLLGEKHDNQDHHRLQAWLTRRLLARGGQPALVMEMIDSDRTPALEQYRRENPGETEGLSTAVEWHKSGWPDWSLYRPIVEAVVARDLPVVAGNLPKTQARRIVREGVESLDPETRRRLGLDHMPDEATVKSLTQEIRKSHCDMLPEPSIAAMIHVQRGRDASLALAMTEPRPDATGALLIAGAGHARTDRGVPVHLRERTPERRVFSIAFLEVDKDLHEASAYAETFGSSILPFDLVWFTPRHDDEDPCAKMAEQMKGKK